MVVTLLFSPLQPQSDTKIIPHKKATLMTGSFILADSMLEVYHECLIYVYWIRGWVKAQEASDQLLVYWKILFSRDSLQVWNVRF